MTTRFQAKGASSGRLTPSNLTPTTNSSLSLLSLTTYGGGSESDQVYLGKLNELIFS
jgi:hypothetical protein